MSDDISVAVAIMGAETQINDDDSIRKRFDKAFTVARDHWMFTDDDLRLRAGTGVVMLSYQEGSKERQQIEHTLNALRTMAAVLSGAGVDINAIEAINKAEMEQLPLLDWYKTETK